MDFLLSLAKEEILWYFSHHDRAIAVLSPKTLPKAPATLQAFDPTIVELICLQIRLKQLVVMHRDRVKVHYLGYLKNTLAPSVHVLLEKLHLVLPSEVLVILQAMLMDMSDASADSSLSVLLS